MPAVAALLLMAAGAVPGMAEESWRDIPYRKLHEAFTAVKPLEDARYIRLRHMVGLGESGMDIDIDQLRLVIASASGDIEVAIGPDGAVDFPLGEALLEENPPVRTNAPAGGLSVSMTIDISAPPTDRFPYALLVDIDDEYGRMVRKQGLMARMMAPKATGLRLHFAGGEPATATIGGPDGPVLHADADGWLHIPSRRDWLRENPEVVLSRTPELISLAIGD